MKKSIFCMSLIALAATLFSCSSSDDQTPTTIENGKLTIKFDNGYDKNDLALNTQTYTTSSNELIKINHISYSVSNVILTKADGTTFTYPKNKSYFLANEAETTGQKFELSEVPTADYTKIQFTIAADPTLQPLVNNFINFSGSFTSANVVNETPFLIATGTKVNATQNIIKLDLPSKALVRTDITPSIHVIIDLSKILDGTTKIKLEGNPFSDETLQTITENIANMFRVDHVHND